MWGIVGHSIVNLLPITNSKLLNSDNKVITLFLIADSVSLSCSSGLKKIKSSQL